MRRVLLLLLLVACANPNTIPTKEGIIYGVGYRAVGCKVPVRVGDEIVTAFATNDPWLCTGNHIGTPVEVRQFDGVTGVMTVIAKIKVPAARKEGK